MASAPNRLLVHGYPAGCRVVRFWQPSVTSRYRVEFGLACGATRRMVLVEWIDGSRTRVLPENLERWHEDLHGPWAGPPEVKGARPCASK